MSKMKEFQDALKEVGQSLDNMAESEKKLYSDYQMIFQNFILGIYEIADDLEAYNG